MEIYRNESEGIKENRIDPVDEAEHYYENHLENHLENQLAVGSEVVFTSPTQFDLGNDFDFAPKSEFQDAIDFAKADPASYQLEFEPKPEIPPVDSIQLSSLLSQLQSLQAQLETERSRHIEEIELLQDSFNQQQLQQQQLHQAELEKRNREHAKELAAQREKLGKTIQTLNDRVQTLSETAARSMESQHEIKEKYRGMKVEYQSLYDLYQELKGVAKDTIEAVKNRDQRIAVLEKMLSERE